MKHIECAGGILQGLNDLFKMLFSGLDKLIKVDVDVKKSEEQQDGTLLMQIDIKNADKDILLVKAVPKDENKTTYDVYLSERNRILHAHRSPCSGSGNSQATPRDSADNSRRTSRADSDTA